jgi:hypothetical protein
VVDYSYQQRNETSDSIKIEIFLETHKYGEIFNVHGSVHRNNILIDIQQDASHRVYLYLGTALHVSGGIITHHQKPPTAHSNQFQLFHDSGR